MSEQVAYDFDGLPVTRQSDLAPIATLTSLGSQEVQVYTGGTPATSNSSGLAGYINQVIKTGTFPGYADADFGLRLAGVLPSGHDRGRRGDAGPPVLVLRGVLRTRSNFSVWGSIQRRREPLYLYPLSVPSGNNVYPILDGPAPRRRTTARVFAPGYGYAQATLRPRKRRSICISRIPHRNLGLRDDVQLLDPSAASLRVVLQLGERSLVFTLKAARSLRPLPMTYLDSFYYRGR